MRPLVLKISAFGSYAGAQTVDFTELQGRTFFLIHGPTGAGKTTILDAICFSLYGDASNEYRDSKSLRSDHAEATTCTEVTFDFAVGQDVYRVRRSPEQVRLKRRGEGTTVQTAEAALWKLAPDDTTALIATGWGKVTESVESILGFKSSQFRQVVLLPQGEFRKLLLADSRDRQEIMQTLFKTELYRTVEEMLKTKAQALKQQFEGLTKESGWILQEAGIQSLAELQEKQAGCQRQLQETSKKVAQQAVQLSQAQAALTKGTVDQKKLMEQQAAEQDLGQLLAHAEKVEVQRNEWLRGSRAAELADAEKALAQREQDVHALLAQQRQYEGKLPAAREELQAAQTCLDTAKSREIEREELAGKILELNSMADRVAALEDARKELQVCAGRQTTAWGLKQKAAAEYTELSQSIEANKQQLQEAMPMAQTESNITYQFEQAQQTLARRRQLEEWREKHRVLTARCHQLVQQEKEQQNNYQALGVTYENLQKRWMEGQAAVLAADLSEGRACPVCGSREHPQKATGTETVPTEQQLKTQRACIDKQEQVCRRIAAELAKLQTEQVMAVDQIRELEQALGDMARRTEEELAQDMQEIQRQLVCAREAQKQVLILQQALANTAERAENLQKQAEESDAGYLAAQAAYKTSEAIMADRQKLIPEAYRDPAALAKVRRQNEDQLVRLKQELMSAQQRVEIASMQLSTLEEACRQTMASAVKQGERLQKEQQLFGERLREAGFCTHQAYTDAKKPVEYMQVLGERLKAFDAQLAAAQARNKRAAQEAANIQEPDMEALQQALNEAKEQYDAIFKEHTILENMAVRQAVWLEKLAQLQAAVEKVDADYRIVGRLADAANGRNAFGLTFQRFVLGTLLDDVAAAANGRLKLMSRSRYYLQRTMDRARKNAAGGLDLEIFDNFTGSTRAVSTLSGGETFLASLALALGLADVVQTYSGGIHLDTIFVDEGFGTLDPEALDFALQALLDLQREGRLVGIISHVPELRERVDARLEIKATEKGSTASFYVG